MIGAIVLFLLLSFFLSVILIVYKTITKSIEVLKGSQHKLIQVQGERISYLEARLSERKGEK